MRKSRITTEIIILAACLMAGPGTAHGADWATTERQLFAAREQWEMTCETTNCYDGERMPDPLSDAYDRAIGSLLSAWAEGQAKQRAGTVVREVIPSNTEELIRLLDFTAGRWIGVTSWGNHSGAGEVEGVVIDLEIERKGEQFVQRTIHHDLKCESSGYYSRFRRNGVRFHNEVEDGDCRGGEIGIRVYDNGTVKWTRFVRDWPVAWGEMKPVRSR